MKKRTRWIIWDTKKQELFSWMFFPSKAAAEKWMWSTLLPLIHKEKPTWCDAYTWKKEVDSLPHLRVLRARWSISRAEIIEGNHKGGSNG